jgi:subtilase family serine protease
MAHKESSGRRLGILLGASLAFSLGVAIAQTPASQSADLTAGTQASRLAGDWRNTAAVAVPFSQPPAASSDLGVAPAGTRLERMLLLLSPSADQQAALTAELANQQSSASSEYHHWLTASEFAAAYANSATDVAAVSAWLQAQGFQVAPLPASRGWIEFSGTAAQVEQAFHTQVHSVATLGGTRTALVSGIRVPGALLPLVNGLVSLDGGLSTPALITPRAVAVSAAELAARTSPNSAEALTPQLHTAGVLGAGESIAIPTRSNVRASDIAAFRSAFSLPASPLTVFPNGSDPGRTADESEAVLAASWDGAAAPGAQIVLVPAATTSATDGLDLALASVVDQALAHTVSVGYSACEASLGTAHQAFYSALYQQAE